MEVRAIPVVSSAKFAQLAAQNPNLMHETPLIVEGYIERWPNYRQWQDIAYLQERFGHLKAFAKAPNFITNRKSSLVSVETDFRRYIDYVLQPERARELYAGCWIDGDYEQFVAQNLPLYCGTLRIVHRADDPVFREVSPLVPPPVRTWNHALPFYYTLFNHFWLLVSLPGALTPLHTDNNGTIALIAQLKGRKRATLYSPADLPHVRNPDVGFMDPVHPDDSDFPSWSRAVKWTGDLEAGQVLFVGTDWAHHVETLETSISVSFDFVNETNIPHYARAVSWATVFGDRIKRNPAVIQGRTDGIISLAEIHSLDSVTIGRRVMRQILQFAVTDEDFSDVATARRSYLTHLEACMV
jgi:hypothetical protein